MQKILTLNNYHELNIFLLCVKCTSKRWIVVIFLFVEPNKLDLVYNTQFLADNNLIFSMNSWFYELIEGRISFKKNTLQMHATRVKKALFIVLFISISRIFFSYVKQKLICVAS